MGYSGGAIFEGTSEDAFLRAVEASIEHDLPLTQADRAGAALRILTSNPAMSDRAIAQSVGLGARAVAELRRSSDAVPKANFRIGRDGKVRPLNGAKGRLRVAELMKENPGASLRQVARTAGVSPATALDVRRRLERGAEPVPNRRGAVECREEPSVEAAGRPGRVPTSAGAPSATTLGKLMRDPSLRQSELGRRLLRLFRENELGANDMSELVASVPSHCVELVVEVSRRNSRIWEEFAEELRRRARFADAE
ncbi:transcriptional regulator [Streptomyces qinzhouensis]|uniref:Transcriptional regulator n=1 Tax=Streptomyces qinzhouensis TaxID=2599401 RepID=A0A5B8JFH8_9ACTN|nr:transcriptional regulator [Streptomyces qinzhouensis]QDY80226.1 transcriptional regulator [Streptomyces qinzhouensis]